MRISFGFGDPDNSMSFECDTLPPVGCRVFVSMHCELAEEDAAPGTYQEGDLEFWRSIDNTYWVVVANAVELANRSGSFSVLCKEEMGDG